MLSLLIFKTFIFRIDAVIIRVRKICMCVCVCVYSGLTICELYPFRVPRNIP